MAFTRVAALLHAALSDVAAGDHHTATVAGDLALADLATRAHADLSDSPTDAHHTLYTDAEAKAAAPVQSKAIRATRTAAAASGDVGYTGAGFAPTAVIIILADGTNHVTFSVGVGDEDAAEKGMLIHDLADTPSLSVSDSIIARSLAANGTDGQTAVLKTMDADGCTLTWTKDNSGNPAEIGFLFLR